MTENVVKQFLCETIEKSMLRIEWVKWLRAFKIYLRAEEVYTSIRKRSKLLHFGGPELQTVAFLYPMLL